MHGGFHLSAGLTAVDLTHDEEMPQEPDAPDTTHVDRLLQRQAVLTARADAKTAADCAMEVSHVVQLTEALLEAGAVIAASTAARHHYLNVQKEHEDNLEQQGPRAQAKGYWLDAEKYSCPCGTKWIRIFWGQAPIGPPDRDQWRDHDR